MEIVIKRSEIKPIFGSYKTFYACAGRDKDSYLLKTGIWNDQDQLTGSTPAERLSRISLLITAYIVFTGGCKAIPKHWINYAKAQEKR